MEDFLHLSPEEVYNKTPQLVTEKVSVCGGSGKGNEALPKHKNYGEEIRNQKKRLLTWGSQKNKNHKIM